MLKFENRPGLYLTIIVHLIALIVFLCIQIHTTMKEETSFVLDFTKEEELERQQKEIEFKKSVSDELDALLSSTLSSSRVRNTEVNTEDLKDSKNNDSRELYKDIRELQEKIDANRQLDEELLNPEEEYAENTASKSKSKEKYTGPSVIRWTLKDRRKMHLPIPAYKCEGAGIVTVAISVNRKGYVKAVLINENESSTDECLREYALKAARKSRFSASGNAPERQAGEIVYSFVAQ